jgi:predicted ATPase
MLKSFLAFSAIEIDIMRFTQYFLYTRQREDRKYIKIEWIEQAVDNPIKEKIQSDGRIRRWAKITEMNKYLRVVLLEDGETIHNAFFDRSFKEESE